MITITGIIRILIRTTIGILLLLILFLLKCYYYYTSGLYNVARV